MHIKKLITVICLVVSAGTAYSQGDYKPMQSVETFKKKLSEVSVSVNSIESDFIQKKHMDILSQDITSNGKFYYQKPDKIRLEYTAPVSYLIVINGKKVKITSDGKSNTYEIGSNPTMKQMNQLLTACMTGNLNLSESDYKFEYKENPTSFLLVVRPQGTAKNYMTNIDIYLDKKDLSVQRLKLTESSGDYTEYTFSNKKFNASLSNEKFHVK